MTFRFDRICYYEIDQYKPPLGGTWHIDFKGVKGAGVYGTLISAPEGLVLEKALEHDRCLLVPAFTLAATLSKQEVSRLLAVELHKLGWGPECNQAGTVVDSLTYDFQPGR